MPYKDPEIRKEYHKLYARKDKQRKDAKARYHKGKTENPALYMLRGARSRARKRGLEFNLEKEDIQIPEYCPILGLKLEIHTGGFKDNSPSLDRINNDLGYVKGNVQVISYKANAMKNNATLEEIEKLYFFMKNLELKPDTYQPANMEGL